MAVQVWFVNGEKTELNVELLEAQDALAEGGSAYYAEPEPVVVAWAHVTHIQPLAEPGVHFESFS